MRQNSDARDFIAPHYLMDNQNFIMTIKSNKSNTAIEICHRYTTRIYEYVNECVAKRRQFSDDDDVAFVSLAFLQKLLLHAKSISVLFASGQVSDAGIIARTMLEGFIYLAWINEDSQVRASKYRNFAAIEDYRQIREADMSGKAVAKDKRELVNARLATLDNSYRNKKSLNGELRPDDDPYQKSWNYDSAGKRIEIGQMAIEIGDDQLKDLYDELSKWSHWSVLGIGRNLNRSLKSVRLSTGNENDAIKSLIVVAISLTGAGIIVDHHLGGSCGEKLVALRDEFILAIRGVSAM